MDNIIVLFDFFKSEDNVGFRKMADTNCDVKSMVLGAYLRL